MKKKKKMQDPQILKIKSIIGSKASGQRVKDITITEFSKIILTKCLELKNESAENIDDKYFELVEFINNHGIRKNSAWDIVDDLTVEFALPERDKEKSKRAKPKDKEQSQDKDQAKPIKQSKNQEQDQMAADIRNVFGEMFRGIHIDGVTTLSKKVANICIKLKLGTITDKNEINEKYFEIVEILKDHNIPATVAWEFVNRIIENFNLPERIVKDITSVKNTRIEQERVPKEKSVPIDVLKNKADLTVLDKFLRGENFGEEFLKDMSKFGKDEAKIFKLLGKSTKNFYENWGKQYKILGMIGATLATGVAGTALIGVAGAKFVYTGAQTLTRAFFAIKGTAQKAYKNHQVEIMKKNIEQLNDFAPKLVDLLAENVTQSTIPEETYQSLSDDDRQIIDDVRIANNNNSEKKVAKKYELLTNRKEQQFEVMKLAVLENSYPEIFKVYETLSVKKHNSGRQKYKLTDIYEFLSKSNIETIDENDIRLVTPKNIKLNTQNISEDFLKNLNSGISLEDLKIAIQKFQELDFQNIGEEEVIQKIKGYQLPETDELFEKYTTTIQMQNEVSAKYKYQLALELQSQVKNMEARMNEYIEQEKTSILTSDAEKEYKRLRELAKTKVEQLKEKGLAEIEEQGQRKYLKVCDNAKELLEEHTETIEPLKDVVKQDQKEIKDVTGRE